ncbi:MAG: ABC transporter substrate-binding protein [Alphaproteobacteria bacterium]|nr:ABC transporter substrate-binding protein [Alphaproteobacteria bacterium]
MSARSSTRRLTRRRFVAGTSAAAVAVAGFPAILRAQGGPIKIGLLHPVTGPISFSGLQCRAGAELAVEAVNAAGGIKSLGGRKLEAVLGDAESKPDVGVAQVEKMNEAGVAAIVGPFASGIALATTQAAAKHGIAHVVDVGVVDQIVERGLANTFRFGPGLKSIVDTALSNLVKINDGAGKPAKTVMLVHEDSAFGSGMAKTLNERLPALGFQVLETIPHATPTRDFTNIALKIKAANPDLVIPSNYNNEYILLARTMRQQGVRPKAIYSILGGGANLKFIKESPDDAAYIIDCNHWFDNRNAEAKALRQKTEAKGLFITYEVMLAHECVRLVADAIERAKSTDRAAIVKALAESTWAGHFMPYGPTKFVNGQNQGARPVNLQVLDKDFKVVFPPDVAEAKPVFPMPRT